MFYPRSLVLGPPSSVGYGFHYVGIGLSSNQVLVGYFHSLCTSTDLACLAFYLFFLVEDVRPGEI